MTHINNLIQKWDEPPADLETDPLQGCNSMSIWLTEYRARLADIEAFNTDYSKRSTRWGEDAKTGMIRKRAENRGRARDHTLLQTLAFLAKQTDCRMVEASAYKLTEFAGLHRDTIKKAITSLRKLGYLRILGVVDRKDDGRHRPLRIVLDLAALPYVQAVPSPCTPTDPFATGDFSHDAFGGHEGLKSNRRDVYSWFLHNPGANRYACYKATGISKMTIGRAVEWLVDEQLAALSAEGGVYALPVRDVAPVLDGIARHQHLQGRTSERLHYARKPYWEIAEARAKAETRINWRSYRAQFDG